MKTNSRAIFFLCVAVVGGLASVYLYRHAKSETAIVDSAPIRSGGANHQVDLHGQQRSPIDSADASRESSARGRDTEMQVAPETEPLPTRVTAERTAAQQERMRTSHNKAVRTLYDELIKELRLNAREAEKLTELIAELQANMIGAQQTAPTDPAMRARVMGEVRKEGDDRVLALLGIDKFYQYQKYEENLGEHLAIVQLTNELGASGKSALSSEQEKQLYTALVEEKAVRLVPTRHAQTESAVAERVKLDQDYRRRVLERAEQILSPEQLAVFRERQERLTGTPVASGAPGPANRS